MKYNVCVQGLGFVGSAMAIAIASQGHGKYSVVGIDLDTYEGKDRVNKINQGLFPFATTDESLEEALSQSVKDRTLRATHDVSEYEQADIVMMNVPFDLSSVTDDNPTVNWTPFIEAAEQIAKRISPTCLVILQSTVIPGTIRKKILPIFEKYFIERSINSEPLIGYSFERVMPGRDYLNSIINNHRCYAAVNEESERRCHEFLSDIVNVEKFPLLKLSTFEAAETAKIMENSFRAVNIAFIEEWADFAETVGIDLNEVINAIKLRETHRNIARPGFGVGGYCLTKDPLFALQSGKEFYDIADLSFPFCTLAVKTNQQMPLRCLKRLEESLGTLENKRILLAGVSYKSDVGDTRFSPALPFYQGAVEKGASLDLTDPLANSLFDLSVEKEITSFKFEEFDAVIFAVNHPQYHAKKIIDTILNVSESVLIFDACNLIDTIGIREHVNIKSNIYIIGKGRVV